MTGVTLSNGQTVAVQSVPPFVFSAIEAAHPLPEEGNVAEALAARERLMRETAWLIALEQVQPPEDWQFPAGLRHAGLTPREGENGRKLDYIEYGLLITATDVQAVQAAMYGVLTEVEIGAAEVAFPGDGGRETAAPYPRRTE